MTKLGMEHYDSGGSVPADPNNPSSMGVPTGVLNAMNIGKHAEGEQIQANPLVSAITTSPTAPMPQSQYNQSSASGGPGDAGTPGPSTNLAKSASSGYDQGHQTHLNSLSTPVDSTQMDASNDLTQNAAHGGEIFKLQPHEQSAASASHFAQYFAKGGESKKVPAMVNPGECI